MNQSFQNAALYPPAYFVQPGSTLHQFSQPVMNQSQVYFPPQLPLPASLQSTAVNKSQVLPPSFQLPLYQQRPQRSLVQAPPQAAPQRKAVSSFRRKLYSKARPARSDPEGKENLARAGVALNSTAFAGREVSVADGKPPDRPSLPITII